MQDIYTVIWRLEWPDSGGNGHQVRISVYRISNLVLMSYPQAGGSRGQPGSNIEPVSGTEVVRGVH